MERAGTADTNEGHQGAGVREGRRDAHSPLAAGLPSESLSLPLPLLLLSLLSLLSLSLSLSLPLDEEEDSWEVRCTVGQP